MRRLTLIEIGLIASLVGVAILTVLPFLALVFVPNLGR